MLHIHYIEYAICYIFNILCTQYVTYYTISYVYYNYVKHTICHAYYNVTHAIWQFHTVFPYNLRTRCNRTEKIKDSDIGHHKYIK